MVLGVFMGRPPGTAETERIMNGQQRSKIFGIGLSKTGTTSLASALAVLGYRVKDYMGIEHYTPGSVPDECLAVIDAHDALTDTPIPSFFRALDKLYPGSKFILTVRDRAAWLRSCRKQFTQAHADKQNEAHRQLFMDLYGCVIFDEQKFSFGYERHLKSVLEYFKDRPNDLLVLDVAAGEGWEKLFAFLGKPIPDQPFPKANVSRISWLSLDALADIVQEAAETVCPALPWPLQRLRRTSFQAGRFVETLLGTVVRLLSAQAPNAACRHIQWLISRRLKSIDATIPMISSISAIPHWEQRKRWNHLWYVQPAFQVLRGPKASAAGRIGVALIQDGQPLLGAVYDLSRNSLLCGGVGKGAFMQDTFRNRRTLHASDGSGFMFVIGWFPRQHQLDPKGSILRAGTLEWETAPVHAVLRSLGADLREVATGMTIGYNKQTLVNPAVQIVKAS